MNAALVRGAITVLCGIAGLMAVRQLTRRGSVATLDAIDRLLSWGDGAIRQVHSGCYGADPAQALEIFLPRSRALDPAVTGRALPVILFIHGGGWVSGCPQDYRFIARRLAPHGYAVALAGYRLHPDARYPDMLHDAAAAFGWITDHGAQWGLDADRIVLMGHSAGAYNAMMLGLDRRWHQGLTHHPCAVVGLAGPYDFLPLDDIATIASFGHVEDLRETQPLHHAHGTAPPILLIHGAHDRRVKPRHSLALARALASAGARSETHVLDAIGHAGLIMRFARPFAQDRRPLARVLDFLQRTTQLPASPPVQPQRATRAA